MNTIIKSLNELQHEAISILSLLIKTMVNKLKEQ